MIVQIFRETRPTAATNILQDNIDQIDNDNTLRSMFSGDSFPTNPAPLVGQPCYRTDLKKLFIYTADGWVEIMGKPIYDPRSISADVFHMDNMTEGANTKIMTAEERDKIITLENDVNSLENDVNSLENDVNSLKNDVSLLNNRPWDVIIEDQKPQGTNGGTFTSGAWRTRDLNTLVFNHNSLASLGGNRFTLPAGTYCIDWDAPAFDVAVHRSALYNYTTSTIVAYGTSMRTGSLTSASSNGTTVITITSPTSFEIRHICKITRDTNGFGVATTFGTEIYTRVRIKKID